MTTTDIQVLAKCELQQDWYTHSNLGATSTGSALAINLEWNRKLAVSFINGACVFTANRNLDPDENSIRVWTVEDTLFPSTTTPIFLDSILAPTNATFLSAIGLDNNIYTLDCSSRFPRWQSFNRPAGVTPVRISLFITRNNVLRIAVLMSDRTIYILDPSQNKWFQDQAIANNAIPVYDFRVGSAFTQTGDMDNSLWGYVVSGGVWGDDMEDGVAIIAADQELPTVQSIQQGKYSSLAYVEIGGNMPRTTPLLFGIDHSNQATYFQANGDGSFSPAYPFGTDLKFTYLDAIFRTGRDVTENLVQWIDFFALDTSGNLWHTRNAAYDTGRISAVKHLSNGDICVPEWESPSNITSKAIKNFDLTMEVNGAGHAYLVTVLDSTSTSATLEAYIQDMSSTGWTTSAIATIDRTESAPEILSRNIYYVELTVQQGSLIPPTALTVKITSSEYCQIDANGVSTSVSSGEVYITKTNTQGQVYLTIPTKASLACPALSVWIEGMDADQWIDVEPTGKIRQLFASITVDDLKKATDQTDQSSTFGNLSDKQLQDLKDSLNQVASGFSNSSTDSTSASLARVQWNRYLHPKSSKDVSRARHRTDTHMGIISHTRTGKAFRIRLRPKFSFEYLPLTGRSLMFTADTVIDTIVSSWGDFWTQVSNGVAVVSDVTLSSLENGVQVAITCVIDGATKAWNGAALFLSQAFDVISEIFKSLKVESGKIFNWLAYFFPWDDIKATVDALRGIFDGQISKTQNYFSQTASSQVDSFISKAKDWLKNNMDNAVTDSGDLKVADYDKPQDVVSNDLPASSSWLSNKVDNSSSSIPIDLLLAPTDAFSSTIQTFMNKLISTGISSDLSKALQDASDFFSTLTSRGAFDQLTLAAFTQIVKDVAVLLLDLGQAVMDTLIDALASVGGILQDAVNATIDIPLISRIFKEVVGLDLTLFNLIVVPMAVPFTILYEILTGQAPFSQSSTQASNALAMKYMKPGQAGGDTTTKSLDISLYSSFFFSLVYGLTDFMLDAKDSITYYKYRPLDGPIMPSRVTIYTNVISAWLLLGAGLLSTPTDDRTRYAAVVAIYGTACATMATVSDYCRQRDPMTTQNNEVLGVMAIVVPFASGVAAFVSGVWHVINIKKDPNSTDKDTAIAVAEITGSIPAMAKIVKFVKDPEISLPVLAVADSCGHMASWVAYGMAIHIDRTTSN